MKVLLKILLVIAGIALIGIGGLGAGAVNHMKDDVDISKIKLAKATVVMSDGDNGKYLTAIECEYKGDTISDIVITKNKYEKSDKFNVMVKPKGSYTELEPVEGAEIFMYIMVKYAIALIAVGAVMIIGVIIWNIKSKKRVEVE